MESPAEFRIAKLQIPERKFATAPPRRRRKPTLFRAGSVTVKLYPTKWHDKKRRRAYRSWVIIWRDQAGRHREKHSDHAAAQARATQLANTIANGEISMEQFRQADRASYQRALELLKPTGKTLELAVSEYVADYFAKQARQIAPTRSCPDILEEMLRVRKQDGAARNTLDDYASRLGRFCKDFTGPVTGLTANDLDTWLAGLDVSRRTRNNYRGNLVDFFQFARRRGYIARDWNPLAEVPKLKNELVRIEIFTPEELSAILNARQSIELRLARRGRPFNTAIPYLCIAAFAGCRHEELCSPGLPTLDWRQVDLDKREIQVLPEVARKIGRDRLVPIPDNLAAWLAPYVRNNGPVCRIANMNNVFQRAAAAAKVRWKDNGLRKSFISYRIALTESYEKTAFEAGTSESRIRHNYRKTEPKREANRWFGIYPSSSSIIQLNFAFK